MRASDYAKAQPLEEPPEGDPVPVDLRRQAILDALRGVKLGAYDQQIVNWAANTLDDPTNRVIVSLLLRVRDAATLGMMALIERIEDRAKKARLEHPGSMYRVVGDDHGAHSAR